MALLIFVISTPVHSEHVESSKSCDLDCHIGAADYDAVLDVLFPRTRFENSYLILRYLPAGKPERQIVLASKENGTLEVIYYSLPHGSERISDQWRELRTSHPHDTPEEIAKSIRVEHRIVHLNARELSKISSSLKALRVPIQLDTSIVLDGSGYDFWFEAPSACNILHVSLSDDDYGDDGKAHPLVRWMNRVRGLVEAAVPTD